MFTKLFRYETVMFKSSKARFGAGFFGMGRKNLQNFTNNPLPNHVGGQNHVKIEKHGFSAKRRGVNRKVRIFEFGNGRFIKPFFRTKICRFSGLIRKNP